MIVKNRLSCSGERHAKKQTRKKIVGLFTQWTDYFGTMVVLANIINYAKFGTGINIFKKFRLAALGSIWPSHCEAGHVLDYAWPSVRHVMLYTSKFHSL